MEGKTLVFILSGRVINNPNPLGMRNNSKFINLILELLTFGLRLVTQENASVRLFSSMTFLFEVKVCLLLKAVVFV